MILKGYKYCIYPNRKQEEQIQKTFGCKRFVYNQCLSYRREKYEKEKMSLYISFLSSMNQHLFLLFVHHLMMR